MSNFDALITNIGDISKEVSGVVVNATALISTLIALGNTAYPYVIKIIDDLIGLYSKLGDGYTQVVALFEKLRVEIETKFAEAGIVTLGDLDKFVASVEEMHKKQLEALK